MNNKIMIGLGLIVILGFGYFTLTKQAPQPSPTVITDEKIKLTGTVKQLNNNSDPAQYSYELTLNSPFYDKLQSTENPVSKVPILSRDKVLQDSFKGYVGKEIIAEGPMAWGLGESRYLEVSTITDLSK